MNFKYIIDMGREKRGYETSQNIQLRSLKRGTEAESQQGLKDSSLLIPISDRVSALSKRAILILKFEMGVKRMVTLYIRDDRSLIN